MKKLFRRSIKKTLKESISNTDSLRDVFGALRGGFQYSPTISVLQESRVKIDKTRALYYNQEASKSNGAFMARSIINGTADYIDYPVCSFGDDTNLTALVNNWIKEYWISAIWQMYRTTLRDSECWIRLRRPFPNPLLTRDEEDVVTLEVVDSDRVVPYYDPVTNLLARVEIDSDKFIEDDRWTPDQIAATGARTYGRVHRIREIITPDAYYYYDMTTGQYLSEYQTENAWGFIGMVRVFNDYDSALKGGSSDLEQAYPFIIALHDVIVQTRANHAYHADPKVKFKLGDVDNFIRNNWPESFVDGKFTGRVSWRGRDVFFMESEEDAEFLEAKMNSTDSIGLAEFLIDCICIAAEVTESILFRAHTEGAVETDEFERFKKKIARKRTNFAESLQSIVKMATKISTGVVQRPVISWPAISVSDLASEAQAIDQITSAVELANRAGVISKKTYFAKLRQFYPMAMDFDTEQAQVLKEQDAEQAQQLKYATQNAKAQLSVNGQQPGTNGATANGHAQLPPGKTRLLLMPANSQGLGD